MKRLMHIIATPRGKESRTLQVSESFMAAFRKKNPGCAIDVLNTVTDGLGELTVKMVNGKYVLLGGKDLQGELELAWKPIITHIERFLAADGYLVSTPMWNFGVPYPLKHYIDLIVQPKYMFRYTDKGPEGLAKNKKMAIVTSRGGDYSPGSPARSLDHLEPYLRAVFGFVGITDIVFINAQPMDALGADVQSKRIEEAKRLAVKTAEAW